MKKGFLIFVLMLSGLFFAINSDDVNADYPCASGRWLADTNPEFKKCSGTTFRDYCWELSGNQWGWYPKIREYNSAKCGYVPPAPPSPPPAPSCNQGSFRCNNGHQEKCENNNWRIWNTCAAGCSAGYCNPDSRQIAGTSPSTTGGTTTTSPQQQGQPASQSPPTPKSQTCSIPYLAAYKPIAGALIPTKSGAGIFDWDNNGVVEFNDFVQFVKKYQADDLTVDYIRDGKIDLLDFLCFKDKFGGVSQVTVQQCLTANGNFDVDPDVNNNGIVDSSDQKVFILCSQGTGSASTCKKLDFDNNGRVDGNVDLTCMSMFLDLRFSCGNNVCPDNNKDGIIQGDLNDMLAMTECVGRPKSSSDPSPSDSSCLRYDYDSNKEINHADFLCFKKDFLSGKRPYQFPACNVGKSCSNDNQCGTSSQYCSFGQEGRVLPNEVWAKRLFPNFGGTLTDVAYKPFTVGHCCPIGQYWDYTSNIVDNKITKKSDGTFDIYGACISAGQSATSCSCSIKQTALGRFRSQGSELGKIYTIRELSNLGAQYDCKVGNQYCVEVKQFGETKHILIDPQQYGK